MKMETKFSKRIKMIKQSMMCDNCGKELITDTPYAHNFNFELRVIDKNVDTAGIQYAVYMNQNISVQKLV